MTILRDRDLTFSLIHATINVQVLMALVVSIAAPVLGHNSFLKSYIYMLPSYYLSPSQLINLFL